MVSNASEDLPEPLSPVMTTRRSRGISTEMFLRLCSRAPVTAIRSVGRGSPRLRRGGVRDGRMGVRDHRSRGGRALPVAAAARRCLDEVLTTGRDRPGTGKHPSQSSDPPAAQPGKPVEPVHSGYPWSSAREGDRSRAATRSYLVGLPRHWPSARFRHPGRWSRFARNECSGDTVRPPRRVAGLPTAGARTAAGQSRRTPPGGGATPPRSPQAAPR